jgi:hypothetical protein
MADSVSARENLHGLALARAVGRKWIRFGTHFQVANQESFIGLKHYRPFRCNLLVDYLDLRQSESRLGLAIHTRSRPKLRDLLTAVVLTCAAPAAAALAQGAPPAKALVDQGEAAAKQQHFPEAFALFGKAADQGDAKAQFEVGRMYAAGRGVEKNCDMAMNWLSKSANQQSTLAQGALASIYFNGDTCAAKDYAKAKMWAQKASDQDDPVSQGLLGMIHLYGYAGKSDYKAAMSLFLKSVGHQYSDPDDAARFEQTLKPGYLFYIGAMYEGGLGVPKDNDKAIAWYQKASELGNSNANDKLVKLQEPPSLKDPTINLVCHNSKGDGYVTIDAARRAVSILGGILMEYKDGVEHYVAIHGNAVEFGCRTLKSESKVVGDYFGGLFGKQQSDPTLMSNTVRSLMCLARNKIDLGTGLWTESGATGVGALSHERTECTSLTAKH